MPAGGRNRDRFGKVSGAYRVLAGDTGLISLVPAPSVSTIFVQTLHIEITTGSVGELWTLQDGAGIAIVPNMAAGAVAHFDFTFGPDGVPCAEATALVLNITGAVGAIGWIVWEAYQVRTFPGDARHYPDAVLSSGPIGYWRVNEAPGSLTAFDQIGGAHNGTYIGAPPSLILGVPPLIDSGSAMQLLTIDVTTLAGVQVPNLAIPRFVTIEAIVKPVGSAPLLSFPRIWSCASTAGFCVDLALDMNGTLSVFLNAVGGAPAWKAAGTITTRAHVAVTWDEAACLVYLNGALIFTDTTDAGRQLTGWGVPGIRYIGYAESGTCFTGVIDEVAIYNRALPAGVLASHAALVT